MLYILNVTSFNTSFIIAIAFCQEKTQLFLYLALTQLILYGALQSIYIGANMDLILINAIEDIFFISKIFLHVWDIKKMY